MGSKEHMKIKKGELLSATTSFKRKAVKVHGAVYSYDKVLYKTDSLNKFEMVPKNFFDLLKSITQIELSE